MKYKISRSCFLAFGFLAALSCSEAPSRNGSGAGGANGLPGPNPGPGGKPGEIDDGLNDDDLKVDKGPASTGPSPLRRLTNKEYMNSVTDLVGDVSAVDIELAAESSTLLYPFTNNASGQLVESASASKFFNSAERIAADVIKDKAKRDRIITCAPVKGTEVACATTVLTALSEKAFRRSATADQLQKLIAVWQAGFKAAADFNTGIEWSLAAILQSPEFLYRIEMGAEKAEGNVVKLDSWDMANRLSFLIWNSLPDAQLVAAAKADKLKTPEEVAAQVDRMLTKDSRARGMIQSFHEQWLGLDTIESMAKDAKVFPGYSKNVAIAMRGEVQAFVDEVIWNGDARLNSLLTSKFTFLNSTLGDFYKIKGMGANFEKVDETKLGGRPVSGLLTMGAPLAKKSSTTDTSPTLRGAYYRVSMFCKTIPEPPNDAVFVPVVPKPGQTRREATEAHSTNPSCSGCHQFMDPMGLVFENFDAAAIYRDKEAGKAVDVSGELVGTDVDGKFNGPSELGAKMGASKDVANCVAKHWFQYAFGRDPESSDDAVVSELSGRVQSKGFLGAIRYITQTPQFFYRTVAEGAK